MRSVGSTAALHATQSATPAGSVALTVRLLNGTGDHSTDAAAREAVLRAGVELVVVGNYRTEGAIQTRVLYRDPTHLAAAEDLAAAIGGGVLFEELLSPVTDLTVVIGSDFMPGG